MPAGPANAPIAQSEAPTIRPERTLGEEHYAVRECVRRPTGRKPSICWDAMIRLRYTAFAWAIFACRSSKGISYGQPLRHIYKQTLGR